MSSSDNTVECTCNGVNPTDVPSGTMIAIHLKEGAHTSSSAHPDEFTGVPQDAPSARRNEKVLAAAASVHLKACVSVICNIVVPAVLGHAL